MDMDQRQLAQKLGIEPPSLSQIETGETKMPRPTTLLKLAEILETNQRWILTGEGNADARDAIVDDVEAISQFEALQVEHRAAIKAMIMTFRKIENG
jgi:transcriptional regulator with XRE-family HTH domain